METTYVDSEKWIEELMAKNALYQAKVASQIPENAQTVYLGYDTGWIYPL